MLQRHETAVKRVNSVDYIFPLKGKYLSEGTLFMVLFAD